MNTIPNPDVPFNLPIPGGMFLGKMITVQGTVLPVSNRFTVNLICQSGDIALHVTPKFKENYVARNSVKNSKWGVEENKGAMPIRPGELFELIILCEQKDFKLAFNGDHFTEFNHRVPIDTISNIAVEGDVVVHNLFFQGLRDSSSQNGTDSLPYGFQPAQSSKSRESESLYPTNLPDPGNINSNSYLPNPRPSFPQPPSMPSHGPGPFPNAPLYPRFPVDPTSYPQGPSPYAPNPSPYPQGPSPYSPNPSSYPQGPSPYSPNPSSYPQGPMPHHPGSVPQHPGSMPHYPGSRPHHQDPSYPQGNYGHNTPQGSHSQGSNHSSGFGSSLGFLGPVAGAALANILNPKAAMNKDANSVGPSQQNSNYVNNAGKALAGILGGCGLAGLTKSVLGGGHPSTSHRPGLFGQLGSLGGNLGGTGLTGGSGFGGSHGRGNLGGILGGTLGSALAGTALSDHLNPMKAAKKQKKAQKKALKYGLPVAGAGLGAYMLHKGLKGFGRRSSSSSCSDSD